MRKEMLFPIAVLSLLVAGCSHDPIYPEDLAANFERMYSSTTFEDCGTEIIEPGCVGPPVSSSFTCFVENLTTCTPAKLTVLEDQNKGYVDTTIYMIVPHGQPGAYCPVERFSDYMEGSIKNGVVTASGGGNAADYKCAGVSVGDSCKTPFYSLGCEDACPPNHYCAYVSE